LTAALAAFLLVAAVALSLTAFVACISMILFEFDHLTGLSHFHVNVNLLLLRGKGLTDL
jgi:hypothetical protein